jgi:16S rRNA (cytosine1402-N4)-methyltransferase
MFVHGSYSNLGAELERLQLPPLSGVLLDLGLSSAQLADTTRGFSYSVDSALDLRFDTSTGRTAADILQHESAEELTRIFRDYGEEPRARLLARAIVEERRTHPVRTTGDLLAIVTKHTHGGGRRSFHPGTLIWQALRIAVNHELDELQAGLAAAVSALGKGGRLAVISFHSGEDRIVKDYFRLESRDCVCPPEFPTCQCGHHASLKLVNRKPIVATTSELKRNSRARSAKLRLAEKL